MRAFRQSEAAERWLEIQWETPTHHCVLYRVDGILELRLIHGERTTRLLVANCRSRCKDA